MNVAESAERIAASTVQMSVERASKRFGGVVAVEDVSVDVPKGSILPSSVPTGPARRRCST
jgi:ABC-type branched-subunit amino acid transport system ATPase component